MFNTNEDEVQIQGVIPGDGRPRSRSNPDIVLIQPEDIDEGGTSESTVTFSDDTNFEPGSRRLLPQDTAVSEGVLYDEEEPAIDTTANGLRRSR